MILAYCESRELRILEPSLSRWVSTYALEYITDHLELLLEKEKTVQNHEAWMEAALSRTLETYLKALEVHSFEKRLITLEEKTKL